MYKKFVYYTDKCPCITQTYGYDRTCVLHGHFVNFFKISPVIIK